MKPGEARPVPSIVIYSPEGTPANVALAEIFMTGGLADQELHLLTNL